MKLQTPTVERLHALRRGSRDKTWIIHLQVSTDQIGGGAKPSSDTGIIRAPAIRGCLRMWWRALHLNKYPNARELALAEQGFWGGPVGSEAGTRSPVQLSVNSVKQAAPRSVAPGEKLPDRFAYALFPLRDDDKQGSDRTEPPAWHAPGTTFRLTVRAPVAQHADLERTIRAWIAFGGIGARTRRGCGSLSVVDDRDRWLLPELSREAIDAHLGEGFFESAASVGRQTPCLRGADLFWSTPQKTAPNAWANALQTLQRFRQGEGLGRAEGERPRPGRSFWPEADKIRRLAGTWPDEHAPLHDKDPAWPRARFGLPILGQFQSKRRGGGRYHKAEPDNFKLTLRPKGSKAEIDRLASPVIVKALALRDGSFAPIVLWLDRAYPDGDVVMKLGKQAHAAEASAAPFDKLLGESDSARFEPFEAVDASIPDGSRLRHAYLTWLRASMWKDLL